MITIRRVFRLLFRISGFLLPAALIAAMVSPFINPYHCWIISFFGLAFPLIWMANLINTAVFYKFRVLSRINLIILLAGMPLMLSHFGLFSGKGHKKEADHVHTLISYNVHGFNDISKKESVFKVQFSTHAFFEQENADILCMQEYPVRRNTTGGFSRNMNIPPLFPWNHYSYYESDGIYMESVELTSARYRIGGKGVVYTPGSGNFAIYSDVELPEGTVRIYNVHLQSLMLREERTILSDEVAGYLERSTPRKAYKTIVKLRKAFILRSFQAKSLAQSIQQSPWPVIVAGDFNDTPASYAYQTISRGLCDSFLSGSRGFSATFAESHYPIRIDHVLVSPGLKVLSYERKKAGYSDHYPVIIRFVFINKK